MELKWMGRYRELVRALIYYSNTSNRNRAASMEAVDGDILLTKHDYQILEYIIEFEDKNHIQADISRDLGILPAMVTNTTKHLLALELIERFRIKGNKKNIVLKPTDKGKKVYSTYCNRDIKDIFQSFFDTLDNLSDDEIAVFEKAIKNLNNRWDDFGDRLLEKM